jgi:exopolysaccharide production protein ExoZ
MKLSHSPARPHQLESVQVLRFVAAFLVMCAHAKMVLRDDEIWTSFDVAMAACGVDVFFVISGFVVAMSAARAASARSFMMDRMLRVLPLYFVVSAAFVAKRILSGEGLTADLVVNSVLFLPLLEMDDYSGTVHPYGWSIAYEMWFYALLALLIGTVAKTGAAAAILCASVLAAGCVVTSLVYNGAWLLPRFVFGPLVLEFAAGCALYVFRDKLKACIRHAWTVLPLCLIALPFTSYLGYPTEVIGRMDMSFARALIWGGLAVSVFVLFYVAEKTVRWPKWLVALGTASYSIYMIQPFVVPAVRQLALTGSARVAVFFVLSTLGGWLMYLWFERPLLAFVRSWAGRSEAPILPMKDVILPRPAA